MEHPWIIKNTCYKDNEDKYIENNDCYNIIDKDVINELKYRRNYMNKNMR